MNCVVAIVEGHGEVEAVPILLRRILQHISPSLTLEIPKPIRVPRTKLLKAGELEKAIELAALKSSSGDGIIVLVDADTDCPKQLAPVLLARARRADREVRVVLAKMEFEAWFLASAISIAGHRGMETSVAPPDDPESIRDAKGWLNRNMVSDSSYRETLDQPALAAVFNLEVARSAPSFDKLWRDFESLLLPR